MQRSTRQPRDAGPSPEHPDEHLVPEGSEPQRLDRYALGVLPGLATVTQAYNAAKRGELTVDGVQREPCHRVRPGELLRYTGPPRPPPPVYRLSLQVPFEDQHLAVVVKPPGIAVSGNQHRTLEHSLQPHLRASHQPDALSWPRPVHRLDFRTGGLVLVAKTAAARAALGHALEQRRVEKRYRALLLGRLEGQGRVDLPVDGRRAESRYRVLRHSRSPRTGWLSTVDLWPLTGRTHQLRQHARHLGHPVLGDEIYGQAGSILRGAGLFLWAVELRLEHPISGQPVQVEIPEPAKFESHRLREDRRWARLREADKI